MEFNEGLTSLANRAQKMKPSLSTEEATKTACVLPFIRLLGYDVFNPLEVVPEFVADVADRKGEKVDYAILNSEGKPIILIECKACGCMLNSDNCEQLHRYFTTVDARIGVLTDGLRYLFFSDLEEYKKMDSRPFMEIDLENIDATLIPELAKLRKDAFDLETALGTAKELKYNRQIKNLLLAQMEEPSEGFVDFFVRELYAGRATKNVREQFAAFVKRAFSEFVEERVDARLKSAIAAAPKKAEAAVPTPAPAAEKVVTTEEEWQGYFLVKSLLMGVVDPARVFIRDAQSYCNVLLDDSRLKPLMRMYFNNPERMRIELIGENKEKTMVDIAGLDDILQYAEAIRDTARRYDAQ
ncbi:MULTISPECIES: type I restriction enzyme HsdR N-terminal domain-containing protein [unclassified Desulfovibrio]|uniref:type I restriction enzyme HsdR N-terminal domain-containing protein n=1 Tax=unclassified Desulfovibrio TaxID=2593640 RepID=UPI0013EB478D|nr:MULTISPECIES: type I restriction enzyme HsdR N-terminal domain-containing protein [unclassified Desulfovibrio]